MQPSISDEKFRSLFKDMPDDEELIESAWQKPTAIFLVPSIHSHPHSDIALHSLQLRSLEGRPRAGQALHL